MTTEQAIKRLESHKRWLQDEFVIYCDAVDALDMAIEALKAQPKLQAQPKSVEVNLMLNQEQMEYILAETKKQLSGESTTFEWIPVSERLPEEEKDVLVTRKFLGCKDGSHGWNNHIPPNIYVEVANRIGDEWSALSDEYKIARSRHTDPVAWMPLPEPWKGEQDDKI